MSRGKCPDDLQLESFISGDLSTIESVTVRVHTLLCPSCRKRLSDLRAFQSVLKDIPVLEPPEGFSDKLLAEVASWDFPPPEPLVEDVAKAYLEEEGAEPEVKGIRLRWSLATTAFFVMSFLQWRFSDILPPILQGKYLMSFAELDSLWNFLFSGAWLRSLKDVVAAIRVDGISSLRILGDTVPTQIVSVLVFGGIVTAVFINQLRSSRKWRR